MSKQTNKEPSNDNTPKSKISKKKIGIISAVSVVAVIVIAAAIGLCIYNTPEKRIERQLALGNKYLEEENYEQAVLAFEQAIAIDNRCMEAYVGGIEAYLKMGDTEDLVNMYEKALGVIAGLDEAFMAENIDAIVEIYLFAETVYVDDLEKIEQLLREGYKKVNDDRLKVLLDTYMVIQWQDEALEKCIKVVIGKEENENIRICEVNDILELSCVNEGIIVIEDLKYFKALEKLNLSYNQISDINVLQYLSNLKIVDISVNNISDISILQNMTNLTGLRINDNKKISDISVLKNLTKLEDLDLGTNNISDISMLENMTNLTGFSIDNNNISDISVMKNMKNIQRVYIAGNNISDISVLSNLENLTLGNLSRNRISDLSALKELKKLEYLNLSDNDISDISPLNNLTKLEYLYLWNNKISDLSALKNLRNLIHLGLSGNNINIKNAINDLPNIEEID